MKAKEILLATVVKNKGNWDDIYRDIFNRVCPEEDELADANAFVAFNKYSVVTLVDAEYPRELRYGYKPPFALFYKEGKLVEKPFAE